MSPLPSWLEELLKALPANIDRRRGAAEISRNLFPVSHRSLEAWPLPVRHVNGRAIVATRELFELAYAKFASAPPLMAARRARRPDQPGAPR